jgi:uncharacterized protein
VSEAPTGQSQQSRNPLDGRARLYWMGAATAIALAAGMAGGVGLAVTDGPWSLALVFTPPLVVAGVSYAWLRWRHWWWAVGREALELGHGVVIRHASYVPYHRIQQIDIDRDLVERALGLARLTVHTASATTDAGIPGLAFGEARELRRYLLEQAGRDDGV